MAEKVIRVTAGLEADDRANGFYMPKYGGTTLNVVQTGKGGGQPGEVVIPAANTLYSINGTTNLDTEGWCYMVNESLTETVDVTIYDSAAFPTPFARMKPGEPCLFRMIPGELYELQKVVTADDVRVIIKILED